jgi:branched-chain amino acid aminotransferase
MTVQKFLPLAFKGGNFIPFEEANVSIATKALHYGTGVFGGVRVIPNPEKSGESLLFRLDRHADRLSRSASFLKYTIDPGYIAERLVEFVRRNKITVSAYVRPFICTTGLGISPKLHEEEFDYLIYGLELGEYLRSDGITCRFSSWVRQEDRSFPLRGKITGAYITSALAKSEAHYSGFDESILLNSQGKVSEASAMNIFLVREGQLITPPVDQDILEGITRASVLQIAKDLGIPVLERAVNKSELLIADEVFLTGSAARIASVKSIESYVLPTSTPIATLLLAKLTSIMEGRELAYSHWITNVQM